MFASNRSFLVTQKGDKSTGMRKNELWASIAKSMSEESGNVRTIKQAKTKIHQIRSREKGPGHFFHYFYLKIQCMDFCFD